MKLPWPFNWLFSWPISLIERFRRFLENTSYSLLCGAGGLVLALSLVASAMVERKDVAVAVAIAGTFIGTAVLSFFLPKFFLKMKKEELEQAALANTMLIEAQRKNQELANAQIKIAHLEGMRINLDQFRSVFNLGLLEIEMHITDFCRKSLGKTEKPWYVPGKDYEDFYVGVLKIPIKAHLGVDLTKVRLKESIAGKIIISNIVPSHIINTGDGEVWPLDEVRSEYMKGDKVVEIESNPADPRRLIEAREHAKQVRGRLKEGNDLKPYEPAIIKAAQHALRALLIPLNKEIEFSDDSGLDGDPILTFLEKHNSRLQRTIEERRKQINPPDDDSANSITT